ncbi:MAG TPA: peptide ABC transporter substrate-binding protein [Tepidiformaceae bacterium]|nr:peptide ABC transporter substrate-binding protein [Tepidiformaceae bacterium]
MITRKIWLLFAIMALASTAIFAAACGDDDDDNGTGADNTSTSGDSGKPVDGGEITVQYAEPESFDPHWSHFAQDIGVQRMVWRGLYRLVKDNKVEPEMASDMPKVSDDGKTVTVKLRSGLKWSDGAPLTAKDFVAGIQRTCDPDNAGTYKDTISNIVGCDEFYDAADKSADEKAALRNAVGVKALDDATVEFKLESPQPTFAMILALWMTFPSPSHVVKNSSDPWPTVDKLVYNGPYKIESYRAKDSAVLVRNDNWYGDRPHLDKITLRYIDQLDVAENAYRANQIQITRANLTNLDVIKTDPTLGKEFLQVPGVTTRAVNMNLEHKPLDNYKVRLALSQATDREALNKVAFRGAYIPSTTWMPPSVAGAGLKEDTFDKTVGFNAEQAKKTLAEAGYPDGKNFPVLNMVISDVPDRRATAEFLKEQWKKILNIEIDVQVVDSKTRSARFTQMDYDMLPGGWTQDYPDPENWVAGLFNTGGANNKYGVSDPKLDETYKKALYNTNNEERLNQWREINKLLSENPMLAGPVLYQESFNYLIKPGLHGPRDQADPLDAMIAGDWNVESWWLQK